MAHVTRPVCSVPYAAAAGVSDRDECGGWSQLFQSTSVYPAGAELFGQDEAVRDVFWLEDGLVKLVRDEPTGCQRILALRSSYGLLGVPFVLVNRPSPVSAIAVTRCRIRRLSGAEFAAAVSRDPRLSWEVHHLQSREVHEQYERIAAFSGSSSRERLERFLRQLANGGTQTHDVRVTLPLKHREVAQLVGVTPEHLSRLLRQLEADGGITRRGKWVVVHPVSAPIASAAM